MMSNVREKHQQGEKRGLTLLSSHSIRTLPGSNVANQIPLKKSIPSLLSSWQLQQTGQIDQDERQGNPQQGGLPLPPLHRRQDRQQVPEGLQDGNHGVTRRNQVHSGDGRLLPGTGIRFSLLACLSLELRGRQCRKPELWPLIDSLCSVYTTRLESACNSRV